VSVDVSVAAKDKSRVSEALAGIAGDLLGGATSSIVAIAYGLSFASLIFAPPLMPWLGIGIVATFVTLAVSAAIMAVRGSFPFVIAGPDGATSAITASLVAALLERLNEVGAPDDLIAPIMIVMALGTGLTGLLLCTLGFLRAGVAVRFVPFPVIGGFLAATGALMVLGGVRVIAEHRLNFANLELFLSHVVLIKLAVAAAVAAAITLALRRSRSPYIVPGIVLGGIALAHVVLWLMNTPVSEAQAEGWMFSPTGTAALSLEWDMEDIRLFPWQIIPSLAGDLLAMMFVTTITMLLNTNGIEFVVRREADLQRDLKVLGVANLVTAALGGYVSCTSLSRTTLNYAAGGRGRLSGLVVALVAAAVLAIGTDFVAYVPRFVLGGLLLYLGANLLYRWLVASMHRISKVDYASLLLVTVIILQWGFIAGVVIGVVISCMTFALSASRVNAIKFSFDGSEYQSSLDRGPDQLAILAARSNKIQGVVLHSYLFFGSASRLHDYIKALFERRPDCRFLVFDFRLVTGIDSSAMHSFDQIRQAADKVGARIMLVNLQPGLRHTFNPLIDTEDYVSDDLDHALELCENAIIAEHMTERAEGRDLVAWLTQALGSADYARELATSCERLDVHEGDVIAAQGDAADSMHFIVRGRIGIAVSVEGGPPNRVRSLGPHTTIGEMGLITGRKRSATILAEADSILYVLGRADFERLNRDHPQLSQALLTYTIAVMAERLRFASNLISVLRR
jgi:sulfate permease, SulP family